MCWKMTEAFISVNLMLEAIASPVDYKVVKCFEVFPSYLLSSQKIIVELSETLYPGVC